MTVNVAVLVPYQDDGTEERRRALDYVTRYWTSERPAESMSWTFSVGVQPPDEPWCKARAVKMARSQLAELNLTAPAGVLIVADADCFVPDRSAVVDAVAAAWRTGWAMPHRLVRRLTESSTRRLVDGDGPWNASVCRSPYDGWEGGGMTVVRADVYAACPLDWRFVGWGNEDEAWGMALRCLYGPPARGDAQLVHLWHPPAKPGHRKNYEPAAVELLARYRQAAKAGPQAVRDLIGEAA